MKRRSRPRPVQRLLLCCALASGALLSACGGDQGPRPPADGSHPTVDTLPAPSGTAGSVTGMPDTPGPGNVGLSGTAPAPAASIAAPADADLAAVADAANPETTGIDVALAEPTPQDALALVRDYYAALEARDYARAYAMWADAGRASGQTPAQFAAGFAQTTHVAATLDVPGRLGAAAGSRFIEVPVAVEAAQQDGSVRRYVGAYTLRRAMVDGATPEQRAWRIASADIREVVQ